MPQLSEQRIRWWRDRLGGGASSPALAPSALVPVTIVDTPPAVGAALDGDDGTDARLGGTSHASERTSVSRRWRSSPARWRGHVDPARGSARMARAPRCSIDRAACHQAARSDARLRGAVHRNLTSRKTPFMIRSVRPAETSGREIPQTSRCTVSGENAGKQTVMCSAPSMCGEL